MSWWRRWPSHGERGLKPLEGRAAAAHVGCCVLWLCSVLYSRTFYPFVEYSTSPMLIFSPYFKARFHALILTLSSGDTPHHHAQGVCHR